MTAPESRPQASTAAKVGRVLAVLVSAGAGAAFLLCAWVAVGSRFGPVVRDPHGYGLLFGSFLGICAAFVLAMALPLAFSGRRRRRLYIATVSGFLAVLVLLVALVATN